jgi:hypothetical protein
VPKPVPARERFRVSNPLGDQATGGAPPDAEPRIFRSERGGELNPFERARLDREYIEQGDAATDTEIRKAMAAARIREREESQEAMRLDRAQRRASELETEKYDREDRRLLLRVILALLVIAVLATIAMAVLSLNSGNASVGLNLGAGFSAAVAIVTGLLLRALTGGGRASIWDWLLQRGKTGPASSRL